MYNNNIITETNEAGIASRNATKMKYLLKENKQLKEQIKDYQSLVTLNKQTLKVALGKDSSEKELPSPLTQQSNGMETYKSSNTFDEESKKLILKLCDENEKLAKFLEKTINERNTSQYTALIYEQIVEQNSQFEEEMAKEYEDKLENKQTQLKTKENIIHELEILKSIPLDMGDVDPDTYIIFRDIISPHNQLLKLQNRSDKLEKRVSEEIYKLKKATTELEAQKTNNLH